MADLKYKFKLFRDTDGRSRVPNLGHDPLFAGPWYIALNVEHQSYCVGMQAITVLNAIFHVGAP